MYDWQNGTIIPAKNPLETPVFDPENASNGLENDQKPSISELARVSDPRIVIRCTPEFAGWVQGLADRVSLNVTQLVVQGLIRMADGTGYHHRMPPRYRPRNPSRRRTYPRPVSPDDAMPTP